MNIKPAAFSPPEAAQAAGFKTFNNCPTLCVEVPDGCSTISVKTSEGKVITFAFVEYAKGKAPQCVDIQTGPGNCDAQQVLVFNKGATPFASEPEGAKAATLTCVVLPS